MYLYHQLRGSQRVGLFFFYFLFLFLLWYTLYVVATQRRVFGEDKTERTEKTRKEVRTLGLCVLEFLHI